jgi:hypothetical protein
MDFPIGIVPSPVGKCHEKLKTFRKILKINPNAAKL